MHDNTGHGLDSCVVMILFGRGFYYETIDDFGK